MAEPIKKRGLKEIILNDRKSATIVFGILIILLFEYWERIYQIIVNIVINRSIYFHVDTLPTGPKSLSERYDDYKMYFLIITMIVKYLIKIFFQFYPPEILLSEVIFKYLKILFFYILDQL
jgi:hypothetical protein